MNDSQRYRDRLQGLDQLFVTPLSWNEFRGEAEVETFLSQAIEQGVGGLILFGGDREATPRLLSEFQDRMREPLLIMADIESGTAQQFDGGTEFPGMMALGATGSETLSYRVGRSIAMEALALGINVVLGPVMDVNTNPLNPIINVRSFGEDPSLVAVLGAAFIRGCQETGAIATAKHFPGHGDTDADSHRELPVIGRGPGSMAQVELPPFEKAVENGVKAVMVGHIALPHVTGSVTTPASLSEVIVTGLLREKLGFGGLIMTDAMIMKGAGDRSREGEAAVRALRAGVDLIVYVNDRSAAVESIASALESGVLDSVVIERALRNVLNTRKGLVSLKSRSFSNEHVVGCPEHLKLARQVADSAATLVRNRSGFFPLSPEETGLFIIYEEDERRYGMELPQSLRTSFPKWKLISLRTGGDGLSGEVIDLIEASGKVLLFVFTSVRAWRGVVDLSKRGREAIDGILRSADRVGVISLGSPYIMRYFPWVDGYACLYSPSVASQRSTVRLLKGELLGNGRLPVCIPGLYPVGWGLHFGSAEVGT